LAENFLSFSFSCLKREKKKKISFLCLFSNGNSRLTGNYLRMLLLLFLYLMMMMMMMMMMIMMMKTIMMMMILMMVLMVIFVPEARPALDSSCVAPAQLLWLLLPHSSCAEL